MNDVQEALEDLRRAINSARSELLSSSTELRCTQGYALDPVRSWVYRTTEYLKEARRANDLVEEIEGIEGAYLDENDEELVLEYNIEEGMDRYTGEALTAVAQACDALAEAIAGEPLLGDGDGVQLVRELLEASGG